MEVQCVIPLLQRIELHIEAIIYRRREYPFWNVSKTNITWCIKQIIFWQCDCKDLRLDASQGIAFLAI